MLPQYSKLIMITVMSWYEVDTVYMRDTILSN